MPMESIPPATVHAPLREEFAPFPWRDDPAALVAWRKGAAWFFDTLVDADLANNTFGWQWVAGCGADVAPYFRVFNPALQGEKFDPGGDYVRTWVPELARLPDRWIHRPWEAPAAVLSGAGVTPGRRIPAPSSTTPLPGSAPWPQCPAGFPEPPPERADLSRHRMQERGGRSARGEGMRNLSAVLTFLAVTGCAGSSVTLPAQAPAPAPGDWPQISLSRVAGGFVQPVHVTHAGDNTGRIFVVEQGGRIRILDNGAALPDPFLDISSRVVCCGEQGLLSVAFPPGFASKKHFYVNYTTRNPDGATVVARFRISVDNANVSDPASEEILLTIPQPFSNHNGGQLSFGPDNNLYIGMGDGGGGGDPQGNGQNPGTLLGKLLRIDTESGTAPYGVPADNPFVSAAGYLPEIWALGLRNPWRFSFDRQTGDLFIGDVGQGAVEEVDFQPAGSRGGENYGWNVMEGAGCYNSATCATAGLTLPVATYDHSQGCSVTGGVVYRGTALPALQGIYFYGDYCSGRIRGLRKIGAGWETAVLPVPGDPPMNIATFGEDEAGNVYVANYANGDLLKILSP